MNRYTLTLVFIIGTLLSGCKNDIDLNAPWIETPVVYGFLDVNDSTQYIRIEKTYQNEEGVSSAEGAQRTDSIYFDTLVVKVINERTQAATFFYKKRLDKEPGFFSTKGYIYSDNGVMQIGASGSVNGTGDTYRLEITSPKTGKKYTSATGLVGKASLESYNLVFGMGQSQIVRLSAKYGSGSVINDALFRLRYKEYPDGNPSETKFLSINYTLDKGLIVDTDKKNHTISSPVYINFLKNNIPEKSGYTREIVGFDFISVGGSAEMKNIIDLSKPSTVIVQKKADFSNISGGALGIYSSRSYTSFADLALAPAQRTNLINSLNASPKSLNFVN